MGNRIQGVKINKERSLEVALWDMQKKALGLFEIVQQIKKRKGFSKC